MRLILVDGTRVEESNLNRVLSFHHADVGKPKVDVLKNYLETIRPNQLSIEPLRESFRDPNGISINSKSQKVRNAVHDADVVFIATDTNSSRRAIQKLKRDSTVDGMMLSCGILIDADNGNFAYECNWEPNTLPQAPDVGYGPENASYAAIVLEATAVAFAMLLSHLKCPDSDFKYCYRRFDRCLRHVETKWELEKSNENGP